MSFSIFIASRTRITSPFFTACPTAALTATTLPGMGADTLTEPAVPAGAGPGAGRLPAGHPPPLPPAHPHPVPHCPALRRSPGGLLCAVLLVHRDVVPVLPGLRLPGLPDHPAGVALLLREQVLLQAPELPLVLREPQRVLQVLPQCRIQRLLLRLLHMLYH